MTPQGIACGVVGAWLIFAAMGATIPSRLKRATPKRPQWTEPADDYEPPTSVPQPDSSWMELVSVDCLSDRDPLLHERFVHMIQEEWDWSEPHYGDAS